MRGAVVLVATLAALACDSAVPVDGSIDAGGVGIDSGAADAPARPEPPVALSRWLTGNAADLVAAVKGPALFLAGGGTDVDAGFEWAAELAMGGDLVVLRASGSDGYNDYLFTEIGGFDSIETLLVDTRALADDPYVEWTLERAEVIFIAGGDQWRYLDNWRGTGVQRALAGAWERNAVIGGTSAGSAILGQFAFSAENGSVYSSEALGDPFNEFMRLERGFLDYPLMAGIITDTHFGARDRMGRLVTFLARIISDGWHSAPLGIGIDERTALLVDAAGVARVVGTGSVYLVVPAAAAESCSAGQPLTFSSLSYYELQAGDELTLPNGTTNAASASLSVATGELSPQDPY